MSLLGLSLSTPSTWSDSSSSTKDEVRQHLIAVHVPTVDVLWHLIILLPLGGDHKSPNGKEYHQPTHPYPWGYPVICKIPQVLIHCGLGYFGIDVQTQAKSLLDTSWSNILSKAAFCRQTVIKSAARGLSCHLSELPRAEPIRGPLLPPHQSSGYSYNQLWGPPSPCLPQKLKFGGGPQSLFQIRPREYLWPSPNQEESSAYRKGIAKYSYFFIGPVGYNIWWENSRNGSFGPKNDLKMQISPFLGQF